MTLPASKSLDLYRGDTYPLAVRIWSDAIDGTPADLTDVVPRAELRTDPGDALILAMDCVVELPNVVHVTIGAGAWPDTVTARARWDLELTYPSGAVRTILAGPVRIVDDVTVLP
jgi:hypothetical protein